MIKFEPSDYIKSRPNIQMTSMIDIMFINLLFFMALFVYFHFETELNISVPKASTSQEGKLASQELIINITKDGNIVLNKKVVSMDELGEVLQKTTDLYPAQAVVIRADQKTFHEHVVRVLDTCAKSRIWNISFATTKDEA